MVKVKKNFSLKLSIIFQHKFYSVVSVFPKKCRLSSQRQIGKSKL